MVTNFEERDDKDKDSVQFYSHKNSNLEQMDHDGLINMMGPNDEEDGKCLDNDEFHEKHLFTLRKSGKVWQGVIGWGKCWSIIRMES